MGEVYGLIGKSLAHSFSKRHFEEKFKREGIKAKFLNFELSSIKEFPSLVHANPKLEGLNVTIPYKQSVIPFMDALSPEALAIGAVNCIQIKDGRLIGHNTDHIGFSRALRPFLTCLHQSALILGSGGASRSVVYALAAIGAECMVVSRTGNQSNRTMAWAEININVISHFKLIVNCTPLGMWPEFDTFPSLPYEAMGRDHLLFDMVYNPADTVFLKKGRVFGAVGINGEDMLRFQAEESWKIWNLQA